jgi:hypothetical protein
VPVQTNQFTTAVDPDDAHHITVGCVLCGRTMPSNGRGSGDRAADLLRAVEQHRCAPRVTTRP